VRPLPAGLHPPQAIFDNHASDGIAAEARASNDLAGSDNDLADFQRLHGG
jgi:hypothetical protein